MLGQVVLTLGTGDRAVPVRRNPGSRPGQAVAERVRVVDLGLVDDQNGLRATTVTSDVLPPRVRHSAERSVPAADQVRAEGMSGRGVMSVASVVRIPRAQRNKATIVLMIAHVPAIAVNGLGMIAATAAPVPPAHHSVALIAPLVVLVPGARASDRQMTAARSWDLFVRVTVLRNPGVRPKGVLAHGMLKETSLPRRSMA